MIKFSVTIALQSTRKVALMNNAQPEVSRDYLAAVLAQFNGGMVVSSEAKAMMASVNTDLATVMQLLEDPDSHVLVDKEDASGSVIRVWGNDDGRQIAIELTVDMHALGLCLRSVRLEEFAPCTPILGRRA